jgi:hypothetical protein
LYVLTFKGHHAATSTRDKKAANQRMARYWLVLGHVMKNRHDMHRVLQSETCSSSVILGENPGAEDKLCCLIRLPKNAVRAELKLAGMVMPSLGITETGPLAAAT